jgi:hypothetical protein
MMRAKMQMVTSLMRMRLKRRRQLLLPALV